MAIRQLIAFVCLLAFCVTAQPGWAAKSLALEGSTGLFLTRAIGDYGAGGRDVLIVYADVQTLDGWVRTWGRPVDETLGGVAVDQSGNLLVCGRYNITTHEEYVATPGFVVKFSKYGDLIWAKDIVFSTFSIMLRDVTADPAGNVYVTGSAWQYDDVAQPEGWFATFGFIFTVKLNSAGEVQWAKRWNTSEYDWPMGEAIVSDGNEVVVAGYFDNDTTGNSDTVMLWYSASDGSLTAAQSLGMADVFVRPTEMEYDDGGNIYVLAWNTGDTDVLLLKYSTGRNLAMSQAWGNQQLNSGSDLSVLGDYVFVGGMQQVGAQPPDNTGYEKPIYDGLMLEWQQDVLVGQRTCHDAASTEDTFFASVAARNEDDIWVTGIGPSIHDETLFDEAVGVAWAFNGAVGYPTPREDNTCACNSFDIDNASVLTPLTLKELSAYCQQRRIMLGSLEWFVEPNTPDTRISADVTTGPAPLTVSFDASATTAPYGPVTDYAWDFNLDDGLQYDVETWQVPTTQHTFNEPGTYIVTVQATSDDGSTMPATIKITVTN
ncbi:PKD domain-containing protein [bacterium]|nr:PKD domain-containing protein [bacterium]